MGGEGEEQGAMAMAGRAAAAAREKSSFAVTCSLLSQYLKDKKGGLHGLGGLGMVAPAAAAGVFRPPTTMNLLSALDAPSKELNDAAKTTAEPRPSGSGELSVELASTQPPVLVAPTAQQNGENPRESAGEEAQQLTIFYGGKVVVFDNFPSTKVKDLLQIVNTSEAGNASGSAAPRNPPRPSQNNLSDLPIARRNSLHRFLEKRKGRITAKAPYQVNSSVEASKQATGEKSLLGLGQEVTVKQEM